MWRGDPDRRGPRHLTINLEHPHLVVGRFVADIGPRRVESRSTQAGQPADALVPRPGRESRRDRPVTPRVTGDGCQLTDASIGLALTLGKCRSHDNSQFVGR